MSGDGLHEPLGTTPKAPVTTQRYPRPGVIVAALAAIGIAGLGWLAMRDGSERGGEPFAVASIDRQLQPSAKPDGTSIGAAATPGPASAVGPSAAADQTGTVLASTPGQEVKSEHGVKVVRAAREAGSNPVVLKVPQPQAGGLTAAPDPRVTEASPFGLLPKVGAGGVRPAEVYARPPGPEQKKPKIAILLGGMGLDRAETAQAAASLPGAVTFGFAPYGPDLDQQVRRAREAGHEVVLQLPMEDYGRSDSGLSHMLTTSSPGNEDRLRWLMARFTGYAGVGNYMGGRFLGDEAALQPLLRAIAARGLFFVDDGTAARSLVAPLAADSGLAAVRADVVIDAKSDAASIELALHQLEAQARTRGYALGVATGRPGTNAIIKRYTAGLEDGDLALVPVSEISRTLPHAPTKPQGVAETP